MDSTGVLLTILDKELNNFGNLVTPPIYGETKKLTGFTVLGQNPEFVFLKPREIFFKTMPMVKVTHPSYHIPTGIHQIRSDKNEFEGLSKRGNVPHLALLKLGPLHELEDSCNELPLYKLCLYRELFPLPHQELY